MGKDKLISIEYLGRRLQVEFLGGVGEGEAYV